MPSLTPTMSWFAAILVCMGLGQLRSEEPIEQIVYTSTSKHEPLLRCVSDDGRYVAHTAIYFYRNAAGDVQFGGHPAKRPIEGNTWMTGWVQAIRRTDSGEAVLYVSQLVDAPGNSSPLNQALRAHFENELFETQNVATARFPVATNFVGSTGPGAILSSFFGKSDQIIFATKRNDIHFNLLELDVSTGKTLGTVIANHVPSPWYDSQSSLMLPHGEGFVATNSLRYYSLTGVNPNPIELKSNSTRSLTESWTSGGGRGGLSIAPSGKLIAASYQQGIVLCDFRGEIRATVGIEIPRQSSRYLACVADTKVFIADREGKLSLFDTSINKVVAELKLPSITAIRSEEFAPIQTAKEGRYVVLPVIELGQDRVLVFLIENDEILGPWRICDPATGGVLHNASHTQASNNSSWLAVESETYNRLPRIITVNLDLLTTKRNPEND